MRLVRWLTAALALVSLAACHGQPIRPAQPPSHKPALSKVLVIVIENKGYEGTRRKAPHLRALGDAYGLATRYKAITHPSRPNYYAISAGWTFGLDDHLTEITGPTVLSRTLRAGRTARVYMESMPSPCRETNAGKKYVARHNPWVLVRGERTDCVRNDVPMAPRLYEDIRTGNLPNVGFLIPNNCNNAHDCPLATADEWVNQQIGRIAQGPDWKSRRLLIVITADEDDRNEDNHIFTALLNPQLSHTQVNTPFDHYALSRALAAFGHTTPLRAATKAPDLLAAFGLPRP
jgi:phosphatidylinositol-3-phosphatase